MPSYRIGTKKRGNLEEENVETTGELGESFVLLYSAGMSRDLKTAPKDSEHVRITDDYCRKIPKYGKLITCAQLTGLFKIIHIVFDSRY